MRDYAKLVKSMRCCAEYAGCLKCDRFKSGFTCAHDLLNDSADAIEELLAKVPTWIIVEERLPKKDETVIVYYSWIGQSGTEYKEVSLATVEEMKYCGNKLIGWMPLPDPPKEDKP